MAKKAPSTSVADLQPDELNALKALVLEFMNKVQSIDNEIEELKDDRKQLIEDYSEKLDMKTLQLALRVIKLQNSVALDIFIETLTDPAQ